MTSFLIIAFALCIALTTALQCPPGKVPNKDNRCIDCRPGTYSWGGNFKACLPCPANTYTPYSGVVDELLCLPCPAGTSSAPGSKTCHATAGAKAGRASSFRMPPRTRCGSFFIPPPNHVSYFSDRVCISPVHGCPRGMTLYTWARRAVCQTPNGTVKCPNNSVFDGVDRCLSCIGGSRLIAKEGDRKWGCERCSGNAVSKGGLQKSCRTCACGFARSNDGRSCFNTLPKGVKITC